MATACDYDSTMIPIPVYRTSTIMESPKKRFGRYLLGPVKTGQVPTIQEWLWAKHELADICESSMFPTKARIAPLL